MRIGNCSGFYGDRLSALAEIVRDGPVDVVTGDYLAEVTMLILARTRMREPSAGYATTFLRQLEPVAGEIAERGIKVVVNAGGLNPAGLSDALRRLLEKLGVTLSVAHVEGDDLLGRMAELAGAGHVLPHLETGTPLAGWGREPLTANAYLGGFGIKAALDGGADVVVTGRVADASLVAGAAAWWWDWSPDDLDALAGAVVAGHVIECGAQATGGNFSGFRAAGDLRHPGFPLAEVAQDGSSVITKHPGTGGAVTPDTVTAQLLYEIGPPGYLNPDVVARLDSVRVSTDGADRVRLSGTRGEPAPPTTKVAVTSIGGWRNSSTVVLTGIDVDAKAAALEAAVRSALDGKPGVADLRFTRVGVPVEDPPDQMAGSCLLEVSVDGDEAACGRPFSALLVELALANYPGIYYTSPPGNGSVLGAYWPALVPQSEIEQTVVHADGRREVIRPPAAAAGAGAGSRAGAEAAPEAGAEAAPEARTGAGGTGAGGTGAGGTGAGRTGAGGTGAGGTPSLAPHLGEATVDGPLGLLAYARSGDKGGNANVGVWVPDADAYAWLSSLLSIERLRELLPEVAPLEIDRYELANLHAVNFVIHGLLDGGATEARRFDKQAKALGEWLRARHVPLPVRLLAAGAAGS